MTREEAINFLKGYLDEEVYTEKCRNAHKMAIEALEQEPCKEQEIYEKAYKEGYDKGWSDGNFIGANRWIPISERLPEVNQRVLVTSYGRVCYAMMTSADGNSGHPVFRLQDSLNERVVCETTVHSEFTTSRIIAWMPLPEPYKTESEEV